MRLIRHIVSIGIVTLAALVYVHQQVELVKLGYEIDCKEKRLKEMIDRKEILRYNISNLESPSRLENALSSKNISAVYPRKGQVVMMAGSPSYTREDKPLNISGLEERAGIFRLFDFLGGRAEAHAREK